MEIKLFNINSGINAPDKQKPKHIKESKKKEQADFEKFAAVLVEEMNKTSEASNKQV